MSDEDIPRIRSIIMDKLEAAYHSCTEGPLDRARQLGKADIVIGIPFYNETESVSHVVETARQGLRNYYPEANCVIVAAGSPAGRQALETIESLPDDPRINRIAFLLEDEQLNGKGWSVRAISDIARVLGADLVILEADLQSRQRLGEIEGLAPDWVHLLMEPVRRGKADMVISRFNRHYGEAPISNLLAYPLFTAIYHHPIHRAVGSQWGIAHHLIPKYLKYPPRLWSGNLGGYGIDTWIATVAITSGARICEASLGIKIHQPSAAKRDLVLRQVVGALFAKIVEDREWWSEPVSVRQTPFIQPLPTYGTTRAHQPDESRVNVEQDILKYRQGFNKFHPLYKGALPKEIYEQLKSLTEVDNEKFHFPPQLWAQVIYHLLLAYSFGKRFAPGDVLDAVIPLQRGMQASFVLDMQRLADRLTTLPREEMDRLLALEGEQKIQELAEEFLRRKSAFNAIWDMTAEALKPPVPQITYREFIPGVPLVVPTEIRNRQGRTVRANDIYNSIFARQKEEFERFVYGRLNVPRDASSQEVSQAIKDFLRSVEDEILPGINLSTTRGIKEMVNTIFSNFPHGQGFSAIPEMASRFLAHYPPIKLLNKLRYDTLDELLKKYHPLDILALANWTEEQEYLQNLWQLIADGLRTEHFAPSEIRPIIVRHQDFPTLVEMKDTSALDKLTSRIIISNLHKGMGGEFPKIRYLTTIGKNIVEAERFGQIWQRFAADRKDFGRKVVDSIKGHWGRDPLSAHNIFEDSLQRTLLQRVREMTERVDREEAEGDRDRAARYQHIRELTECYHLAMALMDGEFVTCSAWSWASYSFKGGRKSPPPLSLHVERDWASREFLLEYYKTVGGSEEEAEEKIIELIGQGREWANLAPILLGVEKGAEEIVPRATMATDHPPAGMLQRFKNNPVLEPVPEHRWESKYVLNAGAIRLNTRVYLVYRAFGEDEVSRLGLAVSDDGFHFNERLEKPIFEPTTPAEKRGCEDPRLTLIDDRVYMTYTAYDGLVAQIALASISMKDFLNYRWEKWRKHGMVFPGFDDKDAALFPERFNGKFAMLHRVDPHMWITFSPHMRCPWPRREHKILAGTSTGMMWDGRKIGAGAQPLKTKYGWLLVTHGVDFDHIYRLGVMLLDLSNPARLIYRSPNYILEPADVWEVGRDDSSWVPNVVFTCGALPQREDHIFFLDEEDELLIYYGASDTVIGIATAKVGDLIPEEFRRLA